MWETKSKEELLKFIENFERMYESDKEQISELKSALEDLTSLRYKKPMYLEWNIFPEKVPSLNQEIVYINETSQFNMYGVNFSGDIIKEAYYLSDDGEEEIEVSEYAGQEGFTLQLVGSSLQTDSTSKLYWMDSLAFHLKMVSFMEA